MKTGLLYFLRNTLTFTVLPLSACFPYPWESSESHFSKRTEIVEVEDKEGMIVFVNRKNLHLSNESVDDVGEITKLDFEPIYLTVSVPYSTSEARDSCNTSKD